MGLEILSPLLNKQFNCKLTAQVQKVKKNGLMNPWQFVGKEIIVCCFKGAQLC